MSITPKDGDFAKALDDLAKAKPGPTAGSAATPQPLIADEGALLQAEIDRALLPGTGRTPEELQQMAELDEPRRCPTPPDSTAPRRRSPRRHASPAPMFATLKECAA